MIGRLALVVAAAAALAGCHAGTINLAATARTVPADDGFDLTAVRMVESTLLPRGKPRAVLFYVQGSEDRSVTDAAGRLAGFCAMNVPVVAVERRGVHPDGAVDEAAALRFATRERRIDDTLEAMDSMLGTEPPGTPLLLMGASEGADVASAVAARCETERLRAVILLGGGGGWTQEREFRHFIRTRGSFLGLGSESELDAKLAEIRAHPDSDEMWLGHPFRRWSSFMFARSADDLLRVDAPILVVQGGADDMVPVESARALRDEFAAAARTNLTYVEIPGVDHRFVDATTGLSHLPEVELAVVGFLEREGLLSANEAESTERRVRRNHPELFPAGR